MPSNKDRLYIALYARGGAPRMPGLEDTYHWALLVGPKKETQDGRGMRYHAKEEMTGTGQTNWVFEARDVPLFPTNMLLVRILIGKIEDRGRLEYILSNVPIRQGTQGWNCVCWVREALEQLKADKKALGTNAIDSWDKVRDGVMGYCQRKKEAHRFDGQGNFDLSKAATYDLILGVEIVP